ncbi:nitronate monooxygenase, partial [Trifolium medium]|nr:nitronate monooxygenase [Trifolium medium]
MKVKPTSLSLAIQRFWSGKVCGSIFVGYCTTTFLFDYTFVIHQEKEIRRFAGTGEGVGLIKEILPAREVIKRLVEGAQLIIQQNF